MTIRNYLLHGGSNNVAFAITCGTPNHGVVALDANLNSEFNGKGHYLQSLNHAYGDGSEVPPGVKMMTVRSDKLDKYAQPNGIAFGTPQTITGVTYAGPALAGATNIVIPDLDHRELAFYPSAFAEMYKFITGAPPMTTQVTPVSSPTLSGLITGFENGAFTNLPLAGVHLRIYPVTSTESTMPAYEIVTKSDGKWVHSRPRLHRNMTSTLNFKAVMSASIKPRSHAQQPYLICVFCPSQRSRRLPIKALFPRTAVNFLSPVPRATSRGNVTLY